MSDLAELSDCVEAGPSDRWMSRCLELALRGAGRVSPNPLVGAVLVSYDGEVLGEGWHGGFGGPHAEAWAVRDALERHSVAALRNATLYVNLEPCNHEGKTPPCTDLIIEAGIPAVVVGTRDLNPGVAGGGIERLRSAGVGVTVGVRERACRRLNEAFHHHAATGRPLVTLKIAQSLDGQVATTTGSSQWITGLEARTLVHRWRAEMDAVLVGSGTARRDDPSLTVRHVDGRQPVRVVVDGRAELPPELKLFTDEHASRTIAVVADDAPLPRYANRLEGSGGRVLRVGCRADGRLDLLRMLELLGTLDARSGPLPVQSLLVEAGRGIATVLTSMDLVDRFYLFLAPKILGSGIQAFGDLGIEEVDGAVEFAEVTWESVGSDMLFRGYRRSV